MLTYKCFNGLAPKYLADKFTKVTKRSSIHTRYTRNRDLFHIPHYKTATGQRTFTYRETSIWNNLDNHIKQCVSLQSFKQAIKRQLFVLILTFIIYNLNSLVFNVNMFL